MVGERELRAGFINEQLVSLREERHLYQYQMARTLGCSQCKISKIERAYEGNLTLTQLRDYLKALGLEMKIFVEEKNYVTD